MRYVLLIVCLLMAGSVIADETTTSASVTKAKIYEIDKYCNRRKQAFAVKGEKVYATDRYGNKREQTYVVKDKTPPTEE